MSARTLIGAHRAVVALLEPLPESWQVMRFKAVFDRLDRRNVNLEYEMLSLRSTGEVVARAEMGGRQEPDELSLPRYLVAEIGDLVVNPMWLIGGGIGVSRRAGAVSPDYRVFKARESLSPRFIHYLLRSQPYLDQYLLYTRAQTTFDRRVQQPDLDNLPLPVPPLDEQRAIADYLDRETARIDTLIEEQQRLIEMLRERRIATVAEALDGHEVTRLRRLVDSKRPMTYGILQAGEPVEGGIVYIGPSDIVGEGMSPDRNALRTTAPEIASAYQRSVLAGGDVVVSIGPAYGKVAVVSDDLTGANLTQDTVRVALRPDLVDTRFVVWALLSRQTADYWDYQIMGATFRRLNLGTLARTPIPFPPIDEQRRIAHYLDEQTAKIDTLVRETERFIELARERRAALITAAVAGQIDVREAA